MNLRNHRKIVVVDGHVGFTGGLNIGDEYRGQMKGIGEWRDIHVRIEGAAVRDLQRVFFQDWSFATSEALKPGPYFPPSPLAQGSATIAIIPSGPDTRNEAIQRIFFGAIAGAQKRVWITTPYFVPDQADRRRDGAGGDARSGREARPPQPLEPLGDVPRGAELLRTVAGVRVKLYEYLPGMVHARDEWRFVGRCRVARGEREHGSPELPAELRDSRAAPRRRLGAATRRRL